MTAVETARAVADAVLYEGYLLYPYRAGSPKNAVRWQWGVLMPQDVTAVDSSERSANRTDLVLDGREPSLRATVRFLRVQRRHVEDAAGKRVDRLDVGQASYVPWDEAREEEIAVTVPLPEGCDASFELAGGTETERLPEGAGTLVRTWEPVRVGVVAHAEQPDSPYAVTLVALRVENQTPPHDQPPDDQSAADRPAWLRRALVACHVLLEVDGASFVSQLDPPEWARGFVGQCVNEGVFPVLAGPSDQSQVMLSSPIILYDHPELAPESESTFFDSLEIDELLSLRTLTLTDQERREARGTDPRVAALLREVDEMPEELWERLHGTVRYLDSVTGVAPPRGSSAPQDVPWWDPGSDASVDPDNDAVVIAGCEVRRGSRVVLRPGVRRADAYDLFLAGRTATVSAVLHDVDGNQHLAVSVDDDPGSDLKSAHGRFLYFAPDEVEPLAEVAG